MVRLLLLLLLRSSLLSSLLRDFPSSLHCVSLGLPPLDPQLLDPALERVFLARHAGDDELLADAAPRSPQHGCHVSGTLRGRSPPAHLTGSRCSLLKSLACVSRHIELLGLLSLTQHNACCAARDFSKNLIRVNPTGLVLAIWCFASKKRFFRL